MTRPMLPSLLLLLLACGPGPADGDHAPAPDEGSSGDVEALPDLPPDPWWWVDPDPGHRVVFVTSSLLGGDFATEQVCPTCLDVDYRCNYLAALAGLLPEVERPNGTYMLSRFRAFVAHDGASAEARVFHDDGPYALVDGTPVAHSWAALMAGPLLHPIVVDELGANRSEFVWVGDPGRNCEDWTVRDAVGVRVGISSTTDERWRSAARPPGEPGPTCGSGLPVYCFETYPGEQGWPIGRAGPPLMSDRVW